MNTPRHLSAVRTYRRTPSSALARHAATDAQAARFAAFAEPRPKALEARVPLWDDGLLARLAQPVSRLRE